MWRRVQTFAPTAMTREASRQSTLRAFFTSSRPESKRETLKESGDENNTVPSKKRRTEATSPTLPPCDARPPRHAAHHSDSDKEPDTEREDDARMLEKTHMDAPECPSPGTVERPSLPVLTRTSRGDGSHEARTAHQASSFLHARMTASCPTGANVKYTPLERQILQLKEAHPGMFLMFEVGYKMKMYGEDAKVASQLLHITCYPEKNLMTAMVPVPRLHHHIKRLIAAGHKVGVCRQTETRALKAATDHAHKPFSRALTAVYTAGTWLDDVDVHDDPGQEQVICALTEKMLPRRGVRFSLVAVDVATATVTYDTWDDDALRTALDTRLAHLSPRELVLPRHLDECTREVLSAWSAPAPVRWEWADVPANAVTELEQHISGEALAWALQREPNLQSALALLVAYLAPFQLTAALSQLENYATFSDRTTMRLSSATMTHLELLHNATDGQVKGSLFWLLDECCTAMGRRLLRQWIRRPLIDVRQIAARSEAVSLLRSMHDPVLHRALALLTRLPDLSRGLARISYHLSTPSELVTVLLALHRITHEFREPVSTSSRLLDSILTDLSTGREDVAKWLKAIHIPDARRNDKAALYSDPTLYPDIQAWQQTLQEDQEALQQHLIELRRELRRPALQYTSVSGEEDLIEVRAADVGSVPPDWLRVSATKRAVRFHTPTVVRLHRQRDQHRELLAAAARDAFRHFCSQVAAAYLPLRRVVQALAQLDALASLAKVASRPGYVQPLVSDSTTRLELQQFRHPVSETLSHESYVANDIVLGGDAARGVLLTGSNMGGKSSTVRAIALVLVLAQLGSYVPCQHADVPCLDAIVTRMGARDDILQRKSTFLVEAEETAHILRTATPRTLVLLDEFGRGTSTFDGVALADAVLQSFVERGTDMPFLMFITHYMSLTRKADTYPSQLANKHMAVLVEPDEDGERVVFLHALRDGPASQSFGIHVARLAGLPAPVVQQARHHAQLAAARHKKAQQHVMARRFVLAAHAQDHDKVIALCRQWADSI